MVHQYFNTYIPIEKFIIHQNCKWSESIWRLPQLLKNSSCVKFTASVEWKKWIKQYFLDEKCIIYQNLIFPDSTWGFPQLFICSCKKFTGQCRNDIDRAGLIKKKIHNLSTFAHIALPLSQVPNHVRCLIILVDDPLIDIIQNCMLLLDKCLRLIK